VLPRRLGARFALEAAFLVLLALGAGLAHLRPLYIVIVMAGAWLLVALAELAAERIDRASISYLLPRPTWDEQEAEEERIFVEERTVVAPPEAVAEAKHEEPETPAAEELTVFEPPAAEEPESEPEPEPEPEEAPEAEQPARRRRSFFRRRRESEPEEDAPSPPRHVKLLPRRPAPDEPSRAAQEVAELFGSREPEAEERAEPGGAGK
jgi:hypothetical protein